MANNSLVKKGKCLNIGECQNANNKKILEIDTLEPFVCPDCKTELVPVASGGKGFNLGVIAGVLLLVLAIGGGAYWFFTKADVPEITKETGVEGTPESSVPQSLPDENREEMIVESTETGESVEKTPEGNPYVEINRPTEGENPVLNGKGTISYNYGKYTGDIQNGKAHGNGQLQYFKRTRISENDDKERYAEEGDYVIGLFRNDKVVQIEWFGKDKKLKEVIQIGSSGLD